MITRAFNINLLDAGVVPSNVHINQANVDTVVFTFRIFDGANEIDYSAFDTAHITLSAGGKNILYSPCEIDINAGLIRYSVEPEALGRAGRILGQLDLRGTVQVPVAPTDTPTVESRDINLATPHFEFAVLGSLANMTAGERRVFINELAELVEDAVGIVNEARRLLDLLIANGWMSAATLLASGWTGAEAPYTQTVSVSGITADMTPVVDVALSGDVSEKLAQRDAWTLVDIVETGTDSITVTCLEGKPETDISIQIKAVV